MPRKRKTGIVQAIRQITTQANQLLTRLRDEICVREAQLQGLKREEARCRRLLQLKGRRNGAKGRVAARFEADQLGSGLGAVAEGVQGVRSSPGPWP